MPFTYNNTDLSEVPVKTYADVLVAVSKATVIFPEDNDIKEFHAWLQQLPYNVPISELQCQYDEYADEDADEHSIYYNASSGESKELQDGVDDIFSDDLSKIYVVKKKCWTVTPHGLVCRK